MVKLYTSDFDNSELSFYVKIHRIFKEINMEENYKTVSKLLFPDEQDLNKSSSQKFDEILRKQLHHIKTNHFNKINSDIDKSIEEIASFIKSHVQSVGKEQAILDFQVGLNLLNGYKKNSLIDSKIELQEDSDFGEKTFATFLDILKNYDIDVVKKFIKLGAINNKIWNTKNNKKIDTDIEVETLTQKLNERGY